MTVLAVDSDMLLFRCLSSTEVEVQLNDWDWTRHSDCAQAMERYWEYVDTWCSQMACDRSTVAHCFTHGSAYRRRIFPTYKHNRKDKPKPIGFGAMRAQLMSEPNAFCFSEIEADDVISLFASMPGNEVVVASGDKDLNQIPGWHVWIDTDPFLISDEEAERFTWIQYLTGDATDGIPGCPGVGAVGAKKIVDAFDLSRPMDCWEAIVRVYGKKGKVDDPHSFALTQARLVRMLRWGEYDFDNNTVKPWTPPIPTSSSASSNNR